MGADVWRTEGVNPGMLVYTADGELLGKVKSVREHNFVVDRDNQRDIIVAITMVTEIDAEGDKLILELSSAAAKEHHWQHPPLI